ncbi:MAG: DUF4338 domain-containing protein, partial [Gemmataceae bacterium]|nr:DUF4338 domain-containing protein [Gemmataceae bacterium]
MEACSHNECSSDGILPALREGAFRRADACAGSRHELRVIISVLCDLHSKRWRFFVKDGTRAFTQKPKGHGDQLAEKERVRAALVYERDGQLRNEAIRAFIKSMERRRPTPTGVPSGWCSIYSLMREGRQLASGLREAAALPEGEPRQTRLRGVIDPYLQFAYSGRDIYTGLELGDVWRYFRYTWSNAYLSTPGRKFWVLVRDRAAPNHPVIGIASFGNCVVHQGPRDKLIGWDPSDLLARLDREANKEWAGWLVESLEAQFAGVYLDDFVNAGVIDRRAIKRPTAAAIDALREFAGQNKKNHGQDENAVEYDRDNDIDDVDWLQRARTSLFKAKRAELLAILFEVRRAWQDAEFTTPDTDKLKGLLKTKEGRRSIELLLRRIKSDHVGIDMLEITTCGALPPYNHVLGGKLVAMLLASPEIVNAYTHFYGAKPSVIASSLAGRAVLRPPALVYLGTTSLYGAGSSMYNRISTPGEEVGGKAGEVLRYRELGRTEGFGMTHFSLATSAEIEELVTAKAKDRRVNSIFGEGISPRMRKFRVGLDMVGLPSDELIKHDNPRIVYGVPLASNFADILLGRHTRPKYVPPTRDPKETTRRIADYWRRWLSMRVENPDAVAEVERDTLILPVTHRARVPLPELAEPALYTPYEATGGAARLSRLLLRGRPPPDDDGPLPVPGLLPLQELYLDSRGAEGRGQPAEGAGQCEGFVRPAFVARHAGGPAGLAGQRGQQLFGVPDPALPGPSTGGPVEQFAERPVDRAVFEHQRGRRPDVRQIVRQQRPSGPPEGGLGRRPPGGEVGHPRQLRQFHRVLLPQGRRHPVQ